MKQICPKCHSTNIFISWDKKQRTEFAVCRNCFCKRDHFPWEDTQYWYALDDRVKEYKMNANK